MVCYVFIGSVTSTVGMRMFLKQRAFLIICHVVRSLLGSWTPVELTRVKLRNIEIMQFFDHATFWWHHTTSPRVELLPFFRVHWAIFSTFSGRKFGEIVGLWEKTKVLFFIYLLYLYFFPFLRDDWNKILEFKLVCVCGPRVTRCLCSRSYIN